MTVGKRFTVTSGVLVAFSSAMTIVSALSLRDIGAYVHSLATDTIPGIFSATAIDADVANLRADYLSHISSSSQAEMHQVEQAIAAHQAKLASDMKAYEDAITSSAQSSALKDIVVRLNSMVANRV